MKRLGKIKYTYDELRCPYCESKDIVQDFTSDTTNNYFIVDFICNQCGCLFEQHFAKEDGKYIKSQYNTTHFVK